MFFNFYIKNLFNGLFYRLYSWVAEFNDFSCIGKYYMIVISIEIRFLVLCLVLAKLVLSYQSAFQE